MIRRTYLLLLFYGTNTTVMTWDANVWDAPDGTSDQKSMKGSLQRLLQRYTTSKWLSWILGIGMTGITQSSSLVSLLVVVFVGAGLFTIQSGIAMVVGANIGTTFSSLIIAVVGFGKWSISAIALPLIAVGGLGSIFLPRASWKRIAGIVVSLGLIFLGIDLLKDAVGGLSAGIDLVQYESWGIVGFFLIGIVFTTMIQSSHTVVILALTALYSGLISPSMALGIVIGSNIGTTTTVLLASMGGSYTKRQVAWSHLGFNIILSIIGLLYRNPLYTLSGWIVGGTQNITISIAVFNTLLNTATTLVVMPFLGQFMSRIHTIFPDHQGDQWLKSLSIQISQIATGSISATVMDIIDNDLNHIKQSIISYNTLLFRLDSETGLHTGVVGNESHKKMYEKIYTGLTHCDTLIQSLANQELTQDQELRLCRLEERIDKHFALIQGAKELVSLIDHIHDTQNSQLSKRYLSLTTWLNKSLHTYEKKHALSKKQLKKLPHLSFTQLNSKEINHYDIVRIHDYLVGFFGSIAKI